MESKLSLRAPKCIWITGLSYAGQFTLASQLEIEPLVRRRLTYLLGGGNLRTACIVLGFEAADRIEDV